MRLSYALGVLLLAVALFPSRADEPGLERLAAWTIEEDAHVRGDFADAIPTRVSHRCLRMMCQDLCFATWQAC